MRHLICSSTFLFLILCGNFASAVEIKNSRLIIDGKEQPQFFGAEVQYFRLRGGYEKNIPREEVITLWNKALDKVVEAKMNAVSFYIPWDFHEYAEGKFDFTGTADEDGDGRPDYPSRDIKTFFRLIADHGIKHILVRPGPYINAEWGFLGFGAIPSWFFDKYPDSHMMTSWGWRRPLYDYLNTDFLNHTQLWFKALYEQVLHDQIGPGKPIAFLQIDNETNYQWQSLYKADYGPSAVTRYQQFLQDFYGDLATFNEAHGSAWTDWRQIQPPETPRKNVVADQDWYRFNDQTIYTYLHNIRRLWEDLGVHEPEVMFTLAESYNAPENGLLPNYVYKNKQGVTGLLTVNLYPKTSETSGHVLLNQPFKADLDVKSATEAGNAYLGTRGQEWAMGPEIQTGWWKNTPVTDSARQQTYLTVIGHGLKSFFVYYFNEGQNQDIEWSFDKVKPIFENLRGEWHLENVLILQLANEFWGELQARSDRLLVMGLETRKLIENNGPVNSKNLFFDAPLDSNANPRRHYNGLKFIGERVIAPYQDFLARALEVVDSVVLVKDSASHTPSKNLAIDSVRVASDWNGALLGHLMNANINPRILQGDLSSEADFKKAKVLMHLDSGMSAPRTLRLLRKSLMRGQTVVNFLEDDTARSMGITTRDVKTDDGQIPPQPQTITFYITSSGVLGTGKESDSTAMQMTATGLFFSYDLSSSKNCESILFWQGKTVGYRCHILGGTFIQIGTLFFTDYNSDHYSEIKDGPVRVSFTTALMKEFFVNPQILLSKNAQDTVAFARRDPQHKFLWITVKTGFRTMQSLYLKINRVLLNKSLGTESFFRVTDLLAQKSLLISRDLLTNKGFSITLEPDDSHAYVIEPSEFYQTHSKTAVQTEF